MSDRHPRYWLTHFRDETLVTALGVALIMQIDDTRWAWSLIVIVVVYGVNALLSLIMFMGIVLGFDRE